MLRKKAERKGSFVITFVTYYTEITEEMVDEINTIYRRIASGPFRRNLDHLKFATAMFLSAKKEHPDARMVLLSDRPVTMPPFVEVIVIPRQSNYFEIESFRARVEFLEKFCDEKSHLIFLDSDIIVCGNVEEIFLAKGDIFFTYRILSDLWSPLENKNCDDQVVDDEMIYTQFPINIGFIAVKGGSQIAAAKFFQEMISWLDSCDDVGIKQWSGLQYYLKKLFQYVMKEIDYSLSLDKFIIKYKGANLRFLDGRIYNYTPLAYDYIPLDVKIAHFKGEPRKKQMLLFWKRLSKK